MEHERALILILALLLLQLIVKCLDLVRQIANVVLGFLVLGHFLARRQIAYFKLLVDRLDFSLEFLVPLAQLLVLVDVVVHHFRHRNVVAENLI